MNIIEFLLEDHERLLRDRLEIRRSLDNGIFLKKRIEKYISDLELHETIEKKFLILQLQSLPKNEKLQKLIETCEREHREIWSLIRKLLEAAKTENLLEIQQNYFNFFAFVEKHVTAEERSFFPMLQKLLDAKTLEKLGRKAESYYERYHLKKDE